MTSSTAAERELANPSGEEGDRIANPLRTLQEYGQSVWLDFVSRDLLKSGELARLITEGVRAGHFRAVDPTRAAAVVLGLVDGLSLQLTFDPEAFSVAEATCFGIAFRNVPNGLSG